jgi:hypothetical protein
VDVEAIGIFPHWLMLGREMKVTAVLPDGREQPMIWLKDWDFNWQSQYQYAQLIPLPKGTRLELEAAYDNSADNPKNPSDPPRRVTFGEQTTDEMCLCSVRVVPKSRAAAAALRRANIRAFLDDLPPGQRARVIGLLREEAKNLEGPERPD